MGFVTTDDGVQIFYKDWGPDIAMPTGRWAGRGHSSSRSESP